ncbi:hypothetical protein AAVH_09177 [Aphelenchoides avenae]|nr:hypothetical protein AAVH_09177 [Aphelenchus avenae]
MGDSTADFIDAVKAIPALWDKADAEFKDGKRKPQMWPTWRRRMSSKLRDYYVKTKNKKTPSGAASTEGEASSWVTKICKRVSSSKSQQLVPASSQLHLFEDDNLDSSFGDSIKDAASLNGAPTPKRIKHEKLAMEKRFINVMEATPHQLQSTPSEESAEELYGRTESNPLNVEWATLVIQRILYQAQCPAHPPQPTAADQFNYVTGQGL